MKVLVRDLHPDSITELTASSMREKLKVISDAKDVFRNAVRAHLVRFARELTAAKKTHWETTMAATVKIAVVHKFSILGKVNQLLFPPSTFSPNRMSEYEIELLKLQKKRLKLQEEHPHFHFSEIKDMRVQAMTNQTVPDQPGHQPCRALGEPQLLGVQAVTNQAVLQSSQSPSLPEVHDSLGEPQLLGPGGPCCDQQGCSTITPATRPA